MGVSGCGKSTVGKAVAHHLGCPFVEGDSFHSPQNLAKMTAGEPLDDDDRWPWLNAIAGQLGKPGFKVASCSALKHSHRQFLTVSAGPAEVRFAYLSLTPKELRSRLEQRKNHFWPQALLSSQLAILEEPGIIESQAKTFDGSRPLRELIGAIASWNARMG
jgi:gluconokinase